MLASMVPLCFLLLNLWSLLNAATVELQKKEGQAVIFHLPNFQKCGSSVLSNPQKRDMVTVQNASLAHITTLYTHRSNTMFLNNGTILYTLHYITAQDEGTYSLVSASCPDDYYTLTIQKDYAGTAYWLGWESWSRCDRTCGLASRVRQRECSIPTHCGRGSSRETNVCYDNSACPEAAAEWLTWEPWSRCLTSCGPGTMTRRRHCTVYEKCGTGASNETRACDNNPTCKPTETAEWLPWARWSSCSTSCGPGTRTRLRDCNIYNQCKTGTYYERNNCDFNPPCQPLGSDPTLHWSEWAPWSACTQSCGVQSRDRHCLDAYNRSAPGRCPGDRRTNRTCALPVCKDFASGRIKQQRGGEASVEMPLSAIVGVAAGMFILILVVIILVLVRRLRKKRQVVHAITGPNTKGKRYIRKKSEAPSNYRKSEHVYAEIDDDDIKDDIQTKQEKKLSIITIDNPYVALPNSATPKSGDVNTSSEQVVYNNTQGHVFVFDHQKSTCHMSIPSNSEIEAGTDGIAVSIKCRVDEGGYLAPVMSSDKSKQMKYAKPENA